MKEKEETAPMDQRYCSVSKVFAWHAQSPGFKTEPVLHKTA